MELLKYLGQKQRSALNLTFGLQKNELPLYDAGNILSLYRMVETPMELRWQRRLKTNNLIKLGVRNNVLNSKPTSGVDTRIFERVHYRSSSTFLGFEHNSLDRNVFPQKGVRMMFEGAFIFDDDLSFDLIESLVPVDLQQESGNYRRLTFQMESFIPLNSDNSLKVNPFAGLIMNANNSFADFYLLGGPDVTTNRSIAFIGLDPNELPVESTLGLNVGFQRFFAPNWMLSIDANAAYVTFPEALTTTVLDPAFFGGAGLSVGYRSIVGPIKFTMMYPFDSKDVVDRSLRTYLTLGFRF